MSGETPDVVLAGSSMTRLVSAIPVISAQTGRAVVLVGGLAVMCRLSTPYRATTDLDTVHRRGARERPQLELLVATGATPSGPSGALVHTPYGDVQVDVLEVTDAETPNCPTTRPTASTSSPTPGRRRRRPVWCSVRTTSSR